eukprot:m.75611 g.75611  ORF g.75611 m.75611 type:complete len:279 (+) comp8487_c0_seq2:35-871(+)
MGAGDYESGVEDGVEEDGGAVEVLIWVIGWFKGLLLAFIVLVNLYVFWHVWKGKKNIPSVQKEENNKPENNVLLITAHPDDESMFFGPTLRMLQRENYNVFLLCLSNGDFDGLGETREKELGKAVAVFGMKDHHVINDKELSDDPTIQWPIQKVLKYVDTAVTEWNIGKILTFDVHGISSHPNHISTFLATKEFCKKRNTTLKLYSLETVNVFRKYIGIVDFIFSLSSSRMSLSSLGDWLAIKRAMVHHKSQMVWFRHLWVVFSRYMYINTLKEVVVG